MVAEALVLDELFQKAHAEKDHQWAEMGHQRIPVFEGLGRGRKTSKEIKRKGEEKKQRYIVFHKAREQRVLRIRGSSTMSNSTEKYRIKSVHCFG